MLRPQWQVHHCLLTLIPCSTIWSTPYLCAQHYFFCMLASLSHNSTVSEVRWTEVFWTPQVKARVASTWLWSFHVIQWCALACPLLPIRVLYVASPDFPLWPCSHLLNSSRSLIHIKDNFSPPFWIGGLPWWLSGKEPTCQCRRRGFNPWQGSNCRSTQISLQSNEPLQHNCWSPHTSEPVLHNKRSHHTPH